MRPTIRQLEYLIVVAETGSFSRASKRLGVSQPALSTQFADMEASLGVKLVERRNKGLLLTEAGNIALSHARRIYEENHAMRRALKVLTKPFTGNLKIGVLPSIGAYFLPDVTRQLHARYPELRLQIAEARTIELETSLSEGTNDVIISAFRPHPELEAIHLFDETLWICTAVENPLMAETGPIKLSELKGQSLINLGDGFGLSHIIETLAYQAEATVSREYRGVSLDAARQMAVMGAGVAVMPSLYALTEAKRDAAFVIRRIDHADAIHGVHLIWRRTSPLRSMFSVLAQELIAIKHGMSIEDDIVTA